MPWPTIQFESYEAWAAAGRPVGGVFPVPYQDRRESKAWPPRYDNVRAYYIALPTGQLWSPWGRAFSPELGYHGDGWNVSGPIDRLTVSPSIAVTGYHGHVHDGVITDDVEGRTFTSRTETWKTRPTPIPATPPSGAPRSTISQWLSRLPKQPARSLTPIAGRIPHPTSRPSLTQVHHSTNLPSPTNLSSKSPSDPSSTNPSRLPPN